MNDNKTQPNDYSVERFLTRVTDEQRLADSRQLVSLMRETTRESPFMWGSSIIGFGKLHYKYVSGREGDTMAVGFAPRKDSLVLYGVIDYEQNLELAKQLGPHKTGKGCLYVKNMADIDAKVLKQMIAIAFKQRNTSGK